jgi:hypothetical protein
MKDRMPPKTLAEVFSEYKEPGMKYLPGGRDPWGNPFVYEMRIVTENEEMKEFEVLLRSFGPNGRDESGQGDDIQKTSRGLIFLGEEISNKTKSD